MEWRRRRRGRGLSLIQLYKASLPRTNDDFILPSSRRVILPTERAILTLLTAATSLWKKAGPCPARGVSKTFDNVRLWESCISSFSSSVSPLMGGKISVRQSHGCESNRAQSIFGIDQLDQKRRSCPPLPMLINAVKTSGRRERRQKWCFARTSIPCGAIKASRGRGEEYSPPVGTPLPFIGSVYTGARHRVISLFLSTGRSARAWNPSRFRLAFAPPFVFIRGSRGTLTATCHYVGLSCSRSPLHPLRDHERVPRSTQLLGEPGRWKSSGKRACPRDGGGGGPRERKGKIARVSHVALPMITLFRRALSRLAFII